MQHHHLREFLFNGRHLSLLPFLSIFCVIFSTCTTFVFDILACMVPAACKLDSISSSLQKTPSLRSLLQGLWSSDDALDSDLHCLLHGPIFADYILLCKNDDKLHNFVLIYFISENWKKIDIRFWQKYAGIWDIYEYDQKIQNIWKSG